MGRPRGLRLRALLQSARFLWVARVKLAEEITGSLQHLDGFPSVVLGTVAFPTNQVLNLALSSTRIEDGGNFVLVLAIYFDG